ncbi:hypothetical protein M0802_004890, partial [Mischocyttarus mexicanus]
NKDGVSSIPSIDKDDDDEEEDDEDGKDNDEDEDDNDDEEVEENKNKKLWEAVVQVFVNEKVNTNNKMLRVSCRTGSFKSCIFNGDFLRWLLNVRETTEKKNEQVTVTNTGNRGPVNATIVQVGRGNGGGAGDAGSDLLRLEPPLDLRPAPSPLSDTSTTLQSDNNDTFTGGVDPRLLLGGTGTGGDRNTWEGRYHVKEHRRAGKATFQGQVYNFLERPTGWKCFLYHFSV